MWDEVVVIEVIEKLLGLWLCLVSEDFFYWVVFVGMVLVVVIIVVLIVVNVGFYEVYEYLCYIKMGLFFVDVKFLLLLEYWINDGFMVLFFLIVGIEIKCEMVDGELLDMFCVVLLIFGVIGGMVMFVLIYVVINWSSPGMLYGWGIFMVIDIVFMFGIMVLLGCRVLILLKIFVFVFVIVDDFGVIFVIVFFYGYGFYMDVFFFGVGILVIMLVLNCVWIYFCILYLLLGVVFWYFVYESGLYVIFVGVLIVLVILLCCLVSIEGVVE